VTGPEPVFSGEERGAGGLIERVHYDFAGGCGGVADEGVTAAGFFGEEFTLPWSVFV